MMNETNHSSHKITRGECCKARHAVITGLEWSLEDVMKWDGLETHFGVANQRNVRENCDE